MKKYLSTILLGFYFFCYTIPQGIQSLYITYDRVVIHVLFLSILNLITFLILIKGNKLQELLSPFRNKLHFYSFSIVLLFSCISFIAADNLIEGLVTITKYFIYFTSFILIICLAQIIKKSFLKTFCVFTLFAVFIESGWINYLIYDSVITNGNFLSRTNDFSAFTGNINISAFSLAIKVPVLFYIIFKSQNKYLQLISLILVFTSFLSIFLLFSRAAILAIIFIMISLTIFLIINKKWKVIKKYIAILSFIFLSLISYGIINEKNPSDLMIARFSTVTNPIEDDSVNERLNFYTTAIKSIYMRPLLGVGIGNWKINSIDYSKDIIAEYRVPYVVHNDFLQIAAEIGIFGAIAYIYFVFFPFLISLKQFFYKKDFTLYFLIYLIIGVYIVDSLLNFPLDRVVIVMFFLFTITLFYLVPQIERDGEK
jgi:O-antigen ligase